MVRFFRRKKDDEAAGEQGAPEEEAVAEDGAEEAREAAAAAVATTEDAPPERDEEEAAPVEEAVERTRKTWFGRIGGIFKRGLDDSLWEELEETLIAADTGVQTTIRIIEDVRARVKEESIRDPEQALDVLKEEMIEVLDVDTDRGKIWGPDGDRELPGGIAVILVVGVNGTGKTTSIGKMAHAYKARGKKVVLAAADTFRAAAIEQLKEWGERAGVDVVAHQQGADPGAVAFDALTAAEKREADVVIIDTAGRLHTKANLMEELRKVDRVIQRKIPGAPHEVLLVLDATSGQNAMQQAKYFTDAVGVSAVLLAKLDGTAKGGVVFSICDQLRVPVRFVGTGERPQDLARFEPRTFVQALFAG
ncbi:MAG: signal recognition particle-docking protein FtsY [Chloroflexi bacterium]|nr:signal recognition particle-docking protein FtsY [Chloroflexota bacterium]MCI0816868.1 signal recognition particle-docking protein FtsY [Chloroflexota bacterium]MCI0818876.1 signal recognition particle-docking protein FtsY [Chloroflexota bacterium]MCI0831402.1 signal recognition particle-docking protein FtsY [Chloroflexota bacterium]MCI0882902.1 signal recognition particle-docking protein FtsY [Chloroflexota bacterium]